MKIYNYKTGKAVFVNNEKIEISNKVAEILENYTMFPGNMYQDLGIDKRAFVQDKDEDLLKMAEATEVENFESNGENNFNVTFMLYKGVVFGVYGFQFYLSSIKRSAEELRFIIVAMFQFYLSSIKSD